MKKTKKVNRDNLIDIFLGEYCEFMTNQKSHIVLQDPDNGEEQLVESIITVNAFLMDIDDKYFYYGYDGKSVNGVLTRDSIVKMEVVDEESLNNNEELLNKMQPPSSNEEYN